MITIYKTFIQFPTFNGMHPATSIQKTWRGYSYRSGVKWLKFIQTPRFKAYRDFCYSRCIQVAFRTYYRQKKLHTQMANIQVLFRNYILKKNHTRAARKIQNWWQEEMDYKDFWCATCIQDAIQTYYRQKKLHTQMANIQVLFRNYSLQKKLHTQMAK